MTDTAENEGGAGLVTTRFLTAILSVILFLALDLPWHDIESPFIKVDFREKYGYIGYYEPWDTDIVLNSILVVCLVVGSLVFVSISKAIIRSMLGDRSLREQVLE